MAPKGVISASEQYQGAYRLVFPWGDEDIVVEPLPSLKDATIVADVLSVKEALELGEDVSELQLFHPTSCAHALGQWGCAAARCAAFKEVVSQLQECARQTEGVSETAVPGQALLAAALSLGHAASVVLLAVVQPQAATREGSRQRSLLLEAAEAALSGDGDGLRRLRLLLPGIPRPSGGLAELDPSLLYSALLDPARRPAAEALLRADPQCALIGAAGRRRWARQDSERPFFAAAGWTALHLASEHGQEEAAHCLLGATAAAAEAKATNGEVPAHVAARRGNMGVLRLLLAAAPAAALARSKGQTPLHEAAAAGQEAAVRELLRCRSAQISARALAVDNRGHTPAMLAAMHGHLGSMQRILAAAPAAATAVNVAGQHNTHFAASGGSVPCLQALLAADPAAAGRPDEYGRTPLQAAAEGAHLEAARFLLAAAPATASSVDSWGRTALHAAGMGGSVEVIRLLLAATPDKGGAADESGATPLLFAAERGHAAAIAFLLEAVPGSGLARTPQQSTALHLAAAHAQPEAAAVLLAAHPQLAEQLDSQGRIPIEIAGPAQLPPADVARRSATMRALLPFGDGARTLRALFRAGAQMRPLLADFMACRPPLSQAEWSRIPSPCAGLGRALPAALAHSPEQARQLVRRLPPADAERLRLSARCLHRAQSGLRIYLPQPLVWRILSFFDA